MKKMDKMLLLSLVMNVVITSVETILFPSFSTSISLNDGYLFTFAHITDSQFSGSSPIFEKATLWLAQQENLTFVVHTGDIVDSPSDETAWRNAYEYMHQLDSKCNWGVLTGDNDVVHRNQVDLTNYKKHFGNNSIDQYSITGDKLLFILLSWSNLDGSV